MVFQRFCKGAELILKRWQSFGERFSQILVSLLLSVGRYVCASLAVLPTDKKKEKKKLEGILELFSPRLTVLKKSWLSPEHSGRMHRAVMKVPKFCLPCEVIDPWYKHDFFSPLKMKHLQLSFKHWWPCTKNPTELTKYVWSIARPSATGDVKQQKSLRRIVQHIWGSCHGRRALAMASYVSVKDGGSLSSQSIQSEPWFYDFNYVKHGWFLQAEFVLKCCLKT